MMKHHNGVLPNVSARCMNTSAFPSNLPYYSLLQDSETGSILAMSLMCSDPHCEQCQFQEEYSMDIRQNPIYTEECLLGKYMYSLNGRFSLRISL